MFTTHKISVYFNVKAQLPGRPYVAIRNYRRQGMDRRSYHGHDHFGISRKSIDRLADTIRRIQFKDARRVYVIVYAVGFEAYVKAHNPQFPPLDLDKVCQIAQEVTDG